MTTGDPPQRRDRSGQKYYHSMLNMADQLDCRLLPTTENPGMLLGVCPFHEPRKLQNRKTFFIDARTCRFDCKVCEVKGNAITFAAMVWGVNTNDAHSLLEGNGGEVSIQRPEFQKQEHRPGQRPPIPHINSAVLTRATKFYQEQLLTSYPALRMLAKIGITPEAAQNAGIGFCTGRGLREYLEELDDLYPGEIDESALFNPERRTETLAGRITLTDRDYTGAALWMTSIQPEVTDEKPPWSTKRPSTYGIPGLRPRLFNGYAVDRNNAHCFVTDDARVYMVLAALEHPVIFLAKRQYDQNGMTEQCDAIANRLIRREVNSFYMMTHDRPHNDAIAKLLSEKGEGVAVHNVHRDTFMSLLEPERRDIESILLTDPKPQPEEPRATGQERETQPEAEDSSPQDDGVEAAIDEGPADGAPEHSGEQE